MSFHGTKRKVFPPRIVFFLSQSKKVAKHPIFSRTLFRWKIQACQRPTGHWDILYRSRKNVSILAQQRYENWQKFLVQAFRNENWVCRCEVLELRTPVRAWELELPVPWAEISGSPSGRLPAVQKFCSRKIFFPKKLKSMSYFWTPIKVTFAWKLTLSLSNWWRAALSQEKTVQSASVHHSCCWETEIHGQRIASCCLVFSNTTISAALRIYHNWTSCQIGVENKTVFLVRYIHERRAFSGTMKKLNPVLWLADHFCWFQCNNVRFHVH